MLKPFKLKPVQIGGLDANVVSNAEAEKSCMVICGPASGFRDDVETICSLCGTTVFHLPYAPKAPPKVCGACVLKIVQARGTREEHHHYPHA